MDICVLRCMGVSSTWPRARRELWAGWDESREEEEGEQSNHPARQVPALRPETRGQVLKLLLKGEAGLQVTGLGAGGDRPSALLGVCSGSNREVWKGTGQGEQIKIPFVQMFQTVPPALFPCYNRVKQSVP